jgi:hypothetical protein
MCGILCGKSSQKPSRYAEQFGTQFTYADLAQAARQTAKVGSPVKLRDLVGADTKKPPAPPPPPNPKKAETAEAGPAVARTPAARPATLPRIPEATRMAAARIQARANAGKTFDPKTRSFG